MFPGTLISQLPVESGRETIKYSDCRISHLREPIFLENAKCEHRLDPCPKICEHPCGLSKNVFLGQVDAVSNHVVPPDAAVIRYLYPSPRKTMPRGLTDAVNHQRLACGDYFEPFRPSSQAVFQIH